MRHEDDRYPVCLDRLDYLEKTSGFAFCQRGGRFVEDEDPALALQRSGYLNELPVGDPERADRRLHVDVGETDRVERRPCPLVHFLFVQ